MAYQQTGEGVGLQTGYGEGDQRQESRNTDYQSNDGYVKEGYGGEGNQRRESRNPDYQSKDEYVKEGYGGEDQTTGEGLGSQGRQPVDYQTTGKAEWSQGRQPADYQTTGEGIGSQVRHPADYQTTGEGVGVQSGYGEGNQRQESRNTDYQSNDGYVKEGYGGEGDQRQESRDPDYQSKDDYVKEGYGGEGYERTDDRQPDYQTTGEGIGSQGRHPADYQTTGEGVGSQVESPYTDYKSKDDYVKSGYGGEGYEPNEAPIDHQPDYSATAASTEEAPSPKAHEGGGMMGKLKEKMGPCLGNSPTSQDEFPAAPQQSPSTPKKSMLEKVKEKISPHQS